MSNPLLEAALDYASLGYLVFPLHHPVEDSNGGLKCSCGKDCQHPAKHPKYHKGDLPSGHLNATKDEKQIITWWKRWPQANIGIKATKDSKLAVLDTDPRNMGDVSFKRLMILGNLPMTPEQGTGGGGWQHLFEHPGYNIKDEVPEYSGIDIKANGYIVAPPSRHIYTLCF